MTVKNCILMAIHRFLLQLLYLERRLEPPFRPAWNAMFREPGVRLVQFLINLRRKNEGLKIAEERIDPDEEQSLSDIIDLMADQMRGRFKPGGYERGGNTKTHGVLKATVTIRDDIPAHCRIGIFAEPKTYKAYVRYAGPGPNVPSDIQDVGFLSMAVKLLGVPGEKLMDEEKFTQDIITTSGGPTFVTPNTRENAKLQYWSLRDMTLYYFLNPLDTHLLDMFMQSLWNETQTNPLGKRYWSCTPYLLGEGQAVMYSFVPKANIVSPIPGLPFGKVPFNYLRDNLTKTIAETDVEFDLMIQLQTDPHLMPIEDSSVRWPEKLSPFIPVATVHIPKQVHNFDAMADFTKRLKMNPWHCLPEHRPLGNLNRARFRLYRELSNFRQEMNQVSHLEPAGDEVFE
ncbi:catalase family protein [Methylomonas rivi]|uniref:Catalase family protein n=1 Tax=Methylomonas rivi TaxID=2952226 RepID=A0ABT1U1L0_9GAMM|nr:catalase family protein [Methylomonas sp. WSC-6]MCQ8127711.1 catalase family protein [Methylomonas sp. WSC-6]